MNRQRGSFGVLNLMEEEMPLLILDGGIERRYQELYEYDNDKREDYPGYLLQYTLKGCGYLEKGGSRYPVREGMGFLVCLPENSRYYLPDGSEEGWEFIYLHFDGKAVARFAERFYQISGSPFELAVNSRPIHMLLSLQNRLLGGQHLAKYEGGEWLYGFLCAFLRELEQPEVQNGSSFVRDAVRLMELEYAKLDGVEEVADRIGISFAHFTRCFKEEMGMVPVRYLRKIRIQSAMNDLLNSDDTLETIAKANGFANGNYFGKVFRDYVGMGPTEYRRSRRG